jgi:FkbM family methyltransferase
MQLLPYLCNRNKVSVDIGACLGIYTMGMLCYSKSCVTFEVRPEQASALQKTFRDMKAPVTVHSAGLSDTPGSTQLRVCRSDFGRSTISSDHELPGEVDTITVQTHRLDDYGLTNVGCIKIDVEGHEDAVLAGAQKTLETSLPNIIVELDDNRNPGRIDCVRARLAALNFQGFFLLDGHVRPIAELDRAKWHVPDHEPYVCNFVFVQPPVVSRLPARV